MLATEHAVYSTSKVVAPRPKGRMLLARMPLAQRRGRRASCVVVPWLSCQLLIRYAIHVGTLDRDLSSIYGPAAGHYCSFVSFFGEWIDQVHDWMTFCTRVPLVSINSKNGGKSVQILKFLVMNTMQQHYFSSKLNEGRARHDGLRYGLYKRAPFAVELTTEVRVFDMDGPPSMVACWHGCQKDEANLHASHLAAATRPDAEDAGTCGIREEGGTG